MRLWRWDPHSGISALLGRERSPHTSPPTHGLLPHVQAVRKGHGKRADSHLQSRKKTPTTIYPFRALICALILALTTVRRHVCGFNHLVCRIPSQKPKHTETLTRLSLTNRMPKSTGGRLPFPVVLIFLKPQTVKIHIKHDSHFLLFFNLFISINLKSLFHGSQG